MKMPIQIYTDKQGTFSNVTVNNITSYGADLDWRFSLSINVQADNMINIIFNALDNKGNTILLDDANWSQTTTLYNLKEKTDYTLWAIAKYLVDGNAVYAWSKPTNFTSKSYSEEDIPGDNGDSGGGATGGDNGGTVGGNNGGASSSNNNGSPEQGIESTTKMDDENRYNLKTRKPTNCNRTN